ncbi:MFS transporter [Cryptococcus neoformans]|nr:MFS transporter [Cryptococcus neoformans var. grubii]
MLLIMAGRLGDLYGPKHWWIIGISVMIVTNIGTGFCKTPIEFDICRALCGIGCALSVPNALAILGRTYPPGFTRNITFALLGALAPVGFWCGGAIGSIFGQLAKVAWTFWFTAMFTAVFLGVGIIVLPPDEPHPNSSERHFDWLGATLLALALGLFNFPWNQAPLVGWQEPYVYIIFIVSILFFVAFLLWERHIGLRALIPIEVLKRESLLVYLCLWLGWMSFGTYLFYLTFFLHDIRGYTHPLTVTAQMFPLVPGGFCAALLVPYLIKKFPGHVIFLFAMFGFMCANLFMATAPVHQVYWANTFVGMLLGMFGPDLSFSTGQLIVSNSVDRNLQGIAAGIVSMITNYSQSIGLGMTGTVETYVRGPGTTYDDLLKGYRAAFYFGTGMAGFAVVVVALFVRMPRTDKSSNVH